VETNIGHGESVISIQPALARERIREQLAAALKGDLSTHTQPRADHYALRMRFKHHGNAYRNSFYPGARLEDAETVAFDCTDFLDVMRILNFMRI